MKKDLLQFLIDEANTYALESDRKSLLAVVAEIREHENKSQV